MRTTIFIIFSALLIVQAHADGRLSAEQYRAKATGKYISNKDMTEEQSSFNSYLTVACMTIPRMGGVYNIKPSLIKPMQGWGHPIEHYWETPGCEPQLIGGTLTTLIHLTAENATDRLRYLIALKKFYINEQNRPDIWARFMKVRDTRGNTVLDYLEFLQINKKLMAEETPGVEKMIAFLCENGAEYSVYPKTCSK